LVHLGPRELSGIENKDMILITETTVGKLVYLIPDEETVNPSAVIGYFLKKHNDYRVTFSCFATLIL